MCYFHCNRGKKADRETRRKRIAQSGRTARGERIVSRHVCTIRNWSTNEEVMVGKSRLCAVPGTAGTRGKCPVIGPQYCRRYFSQSCEVAVTKGGLRVKRVCSSWLLLVSSPNECKFGELTSFKLCRFQYIGLGKKKCRICDRNLTLYVTFLELSVLSQICSVLFENLLPFRR